MRHFHKTNQKYFCPTINIDALWSLVSEQSRTVRLTLAPDFQQKQPFQLAAARPPLP